MSLTTLLVALVVGSLVLCVGAIWCLRVMQHSITARLFAGLLAGMGGWVLTALLFDGRPSWPIIVLAALLVMSGGVTHAHPRDRLRA